MKDYALFLDMDLDVRQWLAKRLSAWHSHYLLCENCDDEPTAMPLVIERLTSDSALTLWEYEYILFQLWQEATHEIGADEEREAIEKADSVMRELFKDENLGRVRELLEEHFQKN